MSAISAASLAEPAPADLVSLGQDLQRILADPATHTIGDFAAVLARLKDEFDLLRPVCGPVVGSSLDLSQAGVTNDAVDVDLSALFEAACGADPSSAGIAPEPLDQARD